MTPEQLKSLPARELKQRVAAAFLDLKEARSLEAWQPTDEYHHLAEKMDAIYSALLGELNSRNYASYR